MTQLWQQPILTKRCQPGEARQAAGDQRRVWPGAKWGGRRLCLWLPWLVLISALAAARRGLHDQCARTGPLCRALLHQCPGEGGGRRGRPGCPHIGAAPTASPVLKRTASGGRWDRVPLSNAGGQQRSARRVQGGPAGLLRGDSVSAAPPGCSCALQRGPSPSRGLGGPRPSGEGLRPPPSRATAAGAGH